MRFDAGDIFYGAQIGVEIERFAEGDVDAGSATGDGRGHGAFEGDTVFAHGIDSRLIDALALVRGLADTPANLFPRDFDAGGFQNAPRGGGDFGADAFAGDKRNFVFHGGILLYAKRLRLTKPPGEMFTS